MSVSAIDSRIFRNLFGTQEIRDIFKDETYAEFMITVEAALARAQSAADVIPRESGAGISQALANVNLEYA